MSDGYNRDYGPDVSTWPQGRSDKQKLARVREIIDHENNAGRLSSLTWARLDAVLKDERGS